MGLIEQLEDSVGAAQVLTGEDAAAFSRDWLGKYAWQPMAVLRPADTSQVSQIMRLAHAAGVPVVPVGGNTGLAGGTHAEGALMLSMSRLNKVREVRKGARLAIVEAGVVLDKLHEAAAAHDLRFPMTFGARGSAMLGGLLSTNAGGSNVVRYGNTRALCLGLELVLADGRVLDLMSELHKDNSGYDLKDLFIGAEGTLGVITAAVMKLVPRPRAFATAMVAAPGLAEALEVLNRLQIATGGAVEAFEYMPAEYMEMYDRLHPDCRAPFQQRHDVNILVEIATTATHEAAIGEDGQTPLTAHLETTLAGLMEEGAVLDAVIAQNDSQRQDMWARREAAAEVMVQYTNRVDTDISLPLDAVADFLAEMAQILPTLDPGASHTEVAHLGDGNIHYSVICSRDEPGLQDRIMQRIEDIVVARGGSFSAEHGIGISKLPSMARRKNPVAIAVMRQVKAALDPTGILNPGKVLPPENP